MRAPAWTDRVLWRRRKQIVESEMCPDWNPGTLLHYGRADLKQSDHRPVIAILDIEIAKIDTERRQMVFHDVIKDLGPPDATIVVTYGIDSADDDEDEVNYDNLTEPLLQELSQIGEVTIVRFVGETMWITFRDGQSALTVAKKRCVQICGVTLHLKLKTENWLSQVEKEIELCTMNTVPFCNKSIPNQPDYHSLGIPEIPPGRSNSPQNRSLPPGRPPLPKSPVASPKHVLKAGVISVIPEMLNKNKPPLYPPMSAPTSSLVSNQSSSSNSPTSVLSPVESSAIYEEINDSIVSN